MGRLRRWAREARGHLQALYLATKDPRTPWYAKALALMVLAYAASPLDLIPDPIPVLGVLDDLLLVPLGLLAARALIPEPVLRDCHERAAHREPGDLAGRFEAS